MGDRGNVSGIYQIRSISTNLVYIGQSIELIKRFSLHKRLLRNKRHFSCPKIQDIVDRYGIDDLEFSVLEYCSVKDLLNREQYYLRINAERLLNRQGASYI